MKSNKTIILASASPRRKSILQEHGFNVVVVPADIEEVVQEGESAVSYVTRLAKEKAQAILPKVTLHDETLLIAADTTVVINNHILEKPKDKDEAFSMLRLLSGKTHAVHTGYALFSPSYSIWYIDYVTTHITFHTLSNAQIHQYIETGDSYDKAGGYGIQNVKNTFVKEIVGSYYNVMGLPIEVILERISKMDAS